MSLTHVLLVGAMLGAVAPASVHAAEPVPAPEGAPDLGRPRVALTYGAIAGVVALDVEYGRFYGFASTSLPLSVFVSDEYAAGALGLGARFLMAHDKRWSFDVWAFGIPARTTFFDDYTTPELSLALGLGAGFHFTSPRGFTFGFKVPIVGSAISLERQGFAHATDRAKVFYAHSALTLPVVSFGYRL